MPRLAQQASVQPAQFHGGVTVGRQQPGRPRLPRHRCLVYHVPVAFKANLEHGGITIPSSSPRWARPIPQDPSSRRRVVLPEPIHSSPCNPPRRRHSCTFLQRLRANTNGAQRPTTMASSFDLKGGSRPLSIRELSDKAKSYDWNPSIPFKYWVRAAETIHHEVSRFLLSPTSPSPNNHG